METNRLRAFRVLGETGNLRKAAELLNISHAGLYKSIRVLESEVGVELTTRDGRNIKITHAGEMLLRGLGPVLAAEQNLLSSIKGKSSIDAQLIRVGTFEVFSTYFAPSLFEAMGGSCKMDFSEFIPGEIEKAIVENRIDVGISYLAIPVKGVDHLKVGKVEMGVFTSGNPKFSFKGVADFPFVVPSAPLEGTPTRVQGLDGWPDNEVERTIAFRVSLMETAINLVRSGRAAAFLPKFVVEMHNAIVSPQFKLKRWPSPTGVQGDQAIYLIKARNAPESREIKKLARLLRSLG